VHVHVQRPTCMPNGPNFDEMRSSLGNSRRVRAEVAGERGGVFLLVADSAKPRVELQPTACWTLLSFIFYDMVGDWYTGSAYKAADRWNQCASRSRGKARISHVIDLCFGTT